MIYKKSLTLKDGRSCLLRNAGVRDAAGAAANFNKVHEETDFLLTYPDEKRLNAEDEENFLARWESSPCEVQLCAVVDGEIVGMASVSALGTQEKIKHRATLGISVEKAYWGLGIGHALMDACIECAQKAGYAQLELEVVAENDSAVALYQKFGFAEYGYNPRGFRSRHGDWQALVLMRLELD